MTESLADALRKSLTCDEYLIETKWIEEGTEGFECSLVRGHKGPHRAEGGIHEVNEGVDDSGRKYKWVHEWSYLT